MIGTFTLSNNSKIEEPHYIIRNDHHFWHSNADLVIVSIPVKRQLFIIAENKLKSMMFGMNGRLIIVGIPATEPQVQER